MRGADLTQAVLVGADLTGADLTNARLYQCAAEGLCAHGAIMVRCDLSYADLSHANVTDADLFGATFVRTNLHELIVSGARLPHQRQALMTDPARRKAEQWHKRWPIQRIEEHNE